ncbi:hypothetical protein GTP46_23465 [Duganella sp. FT135W]|uniref:PucR family transcriptional regulator n=1 Tax=Duganella flavida TaxID=2692175 RepID=A0A6L8KEV1_9BURK|nr:PucR family transcriptional regulator [Duganella flavida]MYM25595.1 hypothetical protein [Duganella flavida]
MALSVRQVLRMDVLRHCRILSGVQHLDRPVEHINVLEVVVEGEEFEVRNHLFLSTFAFVGNDVQRQIALIEMLAQAGCAAVLFQEGVIVPLSAPLLACAERVGLPIIEVPGNLFYHQIIAPLSGALLQDESFKLHHALAVHRRLSEITLAGGGLNGVLDAVSSLTGRAVAVVGRWDGLMGWSHAWTGLTPPPNERLLAVTAPCADDGWWMVPLHGTEWLIAAIGKEPLSPLDEVTFNEARSAIALEVFQQRSRGQADVRMKEELLEVIVASTDAEASRALIPRAAALGWSIEHARIAVRIRLTPANGAAISDVDLHTQRNSILRACIRMLSEWDRAGAAAMLNGGLTYLPSDGTDKHLPKLKKRLGEIVDRALDNTGWHCRVGIGSAAEALHGLQTSLTQADAAIAVAASLPELGVIVEYERVALSALLLQFGASDNVQAWQRKVIGALMTAEAQRADLVTTLDVFLDSGESQKQTARLLGIHPKTLKYRIDRITTLLGIDPLKSEHRLSMHLAVKLARLQRT